MRTKIIIALGIVAVSVLLLEAYIYQPQISQTPQQFQVKATPSPQASNANTEASSNVPGIPGSKLKYKVTGASSVVFLTEFKFENDYYNYNWEVDMGNSTEGFLYLEPPPERTNVSIYITAISETGRKSKPLVFTNKKWWSKVSKSGKDYAMEHHFIF